MKRLLTGFFDAVEWLGNKLPDPAILFVIGAILVMVLSHVGTLAGWSVLPKKLVQVTEVALDAAGQPILDASGQPTRRPVLDEHGKVKLELVHNASVNAGAPITNRSLLTGDGAYWAISSMVDNFVRFPPLGIVLVGMLGIGLAERTGFVGAGLKAFMLAVPKRFLTPAMVFLGVMSSLGTDAGYIVLPPVAAALYKSVGRSPLAGIAAVFAGVAGGFNANLLITSLDPLLAGLTGPAAQTIEPSYQVNAACNWWFMIASTFMLTMVGWPTTSWLVERRLASRSPEDGGPTPPNPSDPALQPLTGPEKRGLLAAIALVVVLVGVFVAFAVVPKGPFDSYLRARDGSVVTRADVLAIIEGNPADDPRLAALADGPLKGRDLKALVPGKGEPAQKIKDPARKLSDAQRNGVPGTADHFDRWVESIVPLLFILFIVPGLLYGMIVGTLRTGKQAAKIMVESMAYMAPIIVLAFFAAQFIEYFKYSNLDRMLAYTGGEFLAGADLGPAALIVAFVLVTMTFNLFIASMSAKYAMFAPIFVPMLMLVGISPELTQASYRIGDSVTNIITPLNAYMVIILVVVRQHAPRAGMGSLISMMLPYTFAFTLAWLAMIVVWMNLDLPLGPDGGLWFPAKGEP